jgi:glutamine synthetase
VGEEGVLEEAGRFFLAGQMARVRGLSALASPTVNSYKRLHFGREAPSAVVWAHLNRGALMRLSPNTADGATLEFRASHPSANPYLLLAGLLVAGAHGLRDRLEPPPAVEEGLSSFDQAATDSAQAELLPRDIDDALDALLADDVLVDAFDSRLLSELAAGRCAEASACRAQDHALGARTIRGRAISRRWSPCRGSVILQTC